MHLTNYSLNKFNKDVFQQNNENMGEGFGHKRSLTYILNYLMHQGHDAKKLWKQIKSLLQKTFCSVQPLLRHDYRSCQPDDYIGGMCFEILGVDILIDSKLKPWLIEFNYTPSFWTDSALDLRVKKQLIIDTINILNVRAEARLEYEHQKGVIFWKNKMKKNQKKNLTQQEK